MINNKTISTVMETSLITAKLEDTFSDVKLRMEEACAHHIPVVEGKKLVGIISRIDVLQFMHSKAYSTNMNEDLNDLDRVITIQDVMTPISEVVCLREDQHIKDAVQILGERAFNSLPIIDDQQNLVGLITSKCLLSYFLDHISE